MTGTVLRLNRQFDPNYGIAVEITPQIVRLTANNPSSFTFFGTNSYIIGTETVAVIDPGPDDDVHLNHLLAAIGGRRVSHVLATHTHVDHSPLASRLAVATGALTVGVPQQHRHPSPFSSDSRDTGFDFAFRPNIIVKDGDVIEGEGWRLGVVSTPGHASNHMAYSLCGSGILFSGDHVMAWSTTVVSPPDGSMDDYINSLEKLMERDDRVLLPGHGPPVRRPRSFLRALRSHRLHREKMILRCLIDGHYTVAEITAKLYHSSAEELMPAAQRTVWAHLERLTAQGKVEVEGDLAIGARYRPKQAIRSV